MSQKNDISIILTPLLISAEKAAQLLGVSTKYLWQLDRSGRIPLPIKNFGRRKLWSVAELTAWISAGCPSREKWEKIKHDN